MEQGGRKDSTPCSHLTPRARPRLRDAPSSSSTIDALLRDHDSGAFAPRQPAHASPLAKALRSFITLHERRRAQVHGRDAGSTTQRTSRLDATATAASPPFDRIVDDGRRTDRRVCASFSSRDDHRSWPGRPSFAIPCRIRDRATTSGSRWRNRDRCRGPGGHRDPRARFDALAGAVHVSPSAISGRVAIRSGRRFARPLGSRPERSSDIVGL
jgi:hypothetical protein